MYLYVFMKTVPGMAQQVLNAVVAGGATRAVAVTGPYDVVAKYTDVTWEQLSSSALSPTQIAGVKSTSTMTVVNTGPANTKLPLMPFSSPKWGPRCALVLMKTSPGEMNEAFSKLRRKEMVKAVAPLFGEYDVMAQVCGRDEHHIARQLVEALGDVPEIRSTMTCLILAAHPAKGDSHGGEYRRPRRRR